MDMLFNDRYNQTYFDPTTLLHYNTKKADTKYMSEDEFKELLINWKNSVLANNPKLILVDNQQFSFPISPDLQLWMVKHISTPVLQLPSVEKFCFVMSKDFISKISMDQFTNEANNDTKKNKIKYFGDLEEAKKWLLE
ncbi:MAG TPA: hypothetical protein DCS93_30715 [Microscillaceae bacterium]|nr:hypothetical protein [Microscillaceae bacterium]